MADVTITREGNEFLVRAHTEDGEEFLGDMFGNIFLVGDDTMVEPGKWPGAAQVIGSTPWPRRNGARVV